MFLRTSKHSQRINFEWKQLNPRYVGPLRLNLPYCTPGRESFPGAALSAYCGSSPNLSHSQYPWLRAAGRAPSSRSTNLNRYFLRKTYHLRLDPSAHYAEAAAAQAHNPPQASTSLTLPSLSLLSLSLFQLLYFFPLSLCLVIFFWFLFSVREKNRNQ